MHLRPLRFPKTTPKSAASWISFRHPGYFEGENELLALPPLDAATEDETDARDPTSNTIYGVHHATALVACQIIAGNAFETAYLSYDREGKERVQIAREGLLTRRHYYLQLKDCYNEAANNVNDDNTEDEGANDAPYAITPDFQEWRFPHDALPEPWASLSTSPTSSSSVTTIVPTLPSSQCIITGAGPSTVDSAHIIPQGAATASWFDKNGMGTYSDSNSAAAAVDRPSNICRLRCDLHRDYDSRAFAIVPKPLSSRDKRHSLAVHFLSISNDLKDSATKFHNQLVHAHAVPPEYIFARFAYTVFGLLKRFVLTGSHRRLTLVERGKKDWISKTYQMDHKERDNLYGGGGSRSSSPRKRTRGPSSHQAADDDDDQLSGMLGYRSGDDEERRRGRTRTRRWVFSNDGPDESEQEDQPRAKKRRTSEGMKQQKQKQQQQQLTPSFTASMSSLENVSAREQAGNRFNIL